MKAKYTRIEANYEDLTPFETYDVKNVQCMKQKNGRNYGQVEKIQIKQNEIAKWYEAKFFELYAEAAATLPTVEGAAMDAAMPIMQKTTKKPEINVQMDIGAAIRKGLEGQIEEDLAAGIMRSRRMFEYGA